MYGIFNNIRRQYMRVILFILGLLFSADGLYFASTTSMGVGEAFTVAIGIMFIL